MIYGMTVNDSEFDVSKIISVETSEISLDFAGDNLISSKTTVELSNVNFEFDDRAGTGGYFENEDWYNWVITIYNTEEDEKVWEGRLKKIEIDDSKRTVKLTINDYIQDLVDTVCVINLLNVTPAEAIYAILINEEYLAIPSDRIIYGGFESAESLQQNMKINITYTETDSQKCISVIEELCRISSTSIFQRENKIGCWMWQAYSGVLGISVYSSDVIPGTYKQYTDDSDIYNSYSIAYKSGTSVLYATDNDTESETKYGAGKQIAVPDSENDSASAADFNILFVSKIAGDAAGVVMISRNKNIKRKCSFTAGYHMKYIEPGDAVDLRFSPFTREPIRVTSIKPNLDKRTIDFGGECINYPQLVTLNLASPDAVVFVSGLQFVDDILLRWTKSTADDVMAYKLYFSTTQGYWGDEFINGYLSPLTILYDTLTEIETDCLYSFGPVEPGITYYFRVACVDIWGNKSDYSNVIVVTADSEAAIENIFCLTGDPFTGLMLDAANPYGGGGPGEWARFDEALFDVDVFAPTAAYESPLLRKQGGFTALQYKCLCDPGDMQLQKRYYMGGEFGAWSSLVDADPYGILPLESQEAVQYRVIFNSLEWNNDTFFVIGVN